MIDELTFNASDNEVIPGARILLSKRNCLTNKTPANIKRFNFNSVIEELNFRTDDNADDPEAPI